MAFTVIDIPEEDSGSSGGYSVVDIPEAPQPKGKQPRSWGRSIYDAAGSILQGATFGFGDELTAGVGGALGGNYDEILAKDRGAQKQYEAENPYESMMFEIGGGLPLAFATPGAGAGALTKLATMGSGARTLGQMAKTGAVYGGLTGFGKGEGDGRLGSSAVGLAAGAALPLGIKGVTGTGKVIAQRLDGFPGAAGEAGALFPKQSGATPLTKAEATIFQRLRNVPTEQLTSMQDEMARALTEGTPLYLQEAGGDLGVSELADFARYIANRKGGSGIAQPAVIQRAKDAGPRISGILDELSPERDPYRGGQSLMNYVKDTVESLKGKRKMASSPLYDDAFDFTPEVPKEDLARLIQYNKPLKTALEKARSMGDAAYLPENSTLALHEAKMHIDDMIKTAKNQGNDYEARKLLELQDEVVGLLDENTLGRYADARKTHEFYSGPINEIADGPFGGLLQQGAKPDNVGASVIGMSPTAIREAADGLGNMSPIRDAARAGIQRRLDNMGETSNLAAALVGKAEPRQRLAALMGEDGADNILRRLALEDRMAKGKNLYHRGSTTASNLLEEETFNKSGAVVDRLLKALASPKGALFQTVGDLKNLGLASGKEDLARALAGILFDTEQGAATLQKVIPYATRRNEIASKYDALAAALARGSRPLLNRAIPSPQGE